MISSIETHKHSVYQIPAWIPMYLGRHIRLISRVNDYADVFLEIGAVGILDAIHWDYGSGNIYLSCVFGCDLSALTTVYMDQVEPF